MKDSETDLLGRLTDPGLDPVFAEASRIGVESAWFGHIPFARWLVAASRPQLLVELGAHNGVSYAAFCDAVLANHLPARAAAIDTWQGDAQAGYYGNEVYEDLKAFHDPRYGGFSTLIRARFDDALAQFSEGSIDLLHIDGEHSYASVRHDFEAWKPKLSNRGVVLLHDTQVRSAGYGVWQLWAELRNSYPSFEFLHASGLGVLGVGPRIPAPVAALLVEALPEAIERIRSRFALVGARWQREAEIRLLEPRLENALRTAHEAERTAKKAEGQLRTALEIAREKGYAARKAPAMLQLALGDVTRLKSQLHIAEKTTQEKEYAAAESIARLHATLDGLQEALDNSMRELQFLLDSTIWRATAPLRRLLGLMPLAGRQGLRRLMGMSVRLSTPTLALNIPHTQPKPMPTVAVEATSRSPTSRPTLHKFFHHRIIFVSGEPDTPGHFYRVERYVDAFAAAGASVSWMRIDEVLDRIGEFATTSIVIIWRAVNSPAVQQLIAAARAAGALLVFDIDDLMFRPELARVGIIDAIRSLNLQESEIAAYYHRVQEVLWQADACFTSTAELAVHAQRFDRLTFVLPNGFDAGTLRTSRLAVRRHRMQTQINGHTVRRIGYAAGTRTHQKDFKEAAGAIARILAERPDCLLVLFRSRDGSERMFDPEEFPAFTGLEDRIEWRDLVKLKDLPNEMVRFDINIAPLEIDNPFAEAKSELKYFEAALVEVPTIASPTGPLRRAIRDGETGRLARTEAEWYTALTELLDSPAARQRMAHAAYLDVLWRFGPERRAETARSVLHQLDGGQQGAHAFELEYRRAAMPPPARQCLPEAETVFEADRLGSADVTIIIPLYNYAQFVMEALESVRRQDLEMLDLIVIDDCSTDDSLSVALDWARRHAARFNRLLVVRNQSNSGLALTRNLGFDLAETAFVLPLDADNRLFEDCAARCLQALVESNAAFAYPLIRNFGDSDHLIGDKPYVPMRLAAANYIDAMAMVRKSVWAVVGGFAPIRFGWEDYDFWCRCAEQGFLGVQVDEILAEYRFHADSMLRTITEVPANKVKVIEQLEQHHSWLRLSREI